MKRPIYYNTKQLEAIYFYVSSLNGNHVTASQIVKHFKDTSVAISRPTVYRHLDRLTESGKLRKYTSDGISGACYQYIDNSGNCHDHIHLKCEDCGDLLHLECNKLEEIRQHFLSRHTFKVNNLKTVFYGLCNECRVNIS